MSVRLKQLRFPSMVAVLRGAEAVVGRSLYCTIVIADPSVSRVHACIVQTDSELTIRDLGSKNGIFINERPVGREPVALHVGDVVRFGNVACDVVEVDAETHQSQSTDRPLAPDADDLATTQRRVTGVLDAG